MSDDITADEVMQSLAKSPSFTDKVTTGLAREIAAELDTPANIIAQFGLTATQFKSIAATPLFKQMYQEAKALWHSNTNAVDRIRAKTTMAAEDLIIDAYKRAADPNTSNDSFTKLWKLIIDSSTAAPVKELDATPKDRFTINIVLGDMVETITGQQTTPTEQPLDAEFTEVAVDE